MSPTGCQTPSVRPCSSARRGTGMRILAVGDSYMPPRYFQEAFAALEADHKVEYFQVEDKLVHPHVRRPSCGSRST